MNKDEKKPAEAMGLPEKFAKNNHSLDSIDDTEIMRYMLKLCITRRNAPVDIERLIGKFDNITKFIFAPDEMLIGEKGLSRSELVRFRMIGSMLMRVRLEKLGKKIKADDEPRVAEYLSLMCLSHYVEVMYIVPIIGKYISVPFLISSGTRIEVSATFENVIAVLKRAHGCKEFIMAHSHPFNSSNPSKGDIATTERLFGRMYREGYTLKEHYVVGCDGIQRVPYDKNPLRYLFGDKGK